MSTSNNDLLNVDISKPIELNKQTFKEEGKVNLPAKFFKNMVFGYWFLLRLKEDTVICDDVYNKALVDFLKPFASNTDQNSLYLAFEGDFKMLSKDLKKMIKNHNKPIKVNKSKTEKPPKKLKDKDKDKDDLVSRIVDAALTSTTEPVKPKRKYSRKKNIAVGEVTPDKLTVEAKVIDTKELETKVIDTKELDTKELDTKELDTKVIDTKEQVIDTEVIETEVIETEELETEELKTEELKTEEPDTEVQSFTFTDGFTCLYDINDLSLYDTLSHEPITSRSLQRISLPNNLTMLLDNNNNAYKL